jgi:hypothetical protein
VSALLIVRACQSLKTFLNPVFQSVLTVAPKTHMLQTMAAPISRIEARREALAADGARYERLREIHAQIASTIELNIPLSIELVERANKKLEHWAASQICSPFYVRAWKRILRSHPEVGLRKLIQSDGGMRNAMLQNTPFSFALSDKRFAKAVK